MSQPTTPTIPAAEPGLHKGQLSKFKLTAFGISAYVPAIGMTSYPFLLLTTAGYGAWLAALLSLAATLLIGLTIVHFAKRYVGTGSLYLYIGKVFGPWARYLTGAGLLLGYIAQVACIFVITGMYAGGFLTSLGAGWAAERPAQIAIYCIAGFLALAVTYRGLDASYKVLFAITIISVPLIGYVTGASLATTGVDLLLQASMQDSTFFGIITGVAAAASGIVGFESSASLAYETKDPRKSVPVALVWVPLVLGALFVVSTIAQIPGLMRSQDEIAAGQSGISALASLAGLPPFVGQIVDLVLTVTIFACLIGFVNWSSRFAMGLARDGLLPARLLDVNKAHGSPLKAIAFVLALGLGLIVLLVAANPAGIAPVYTAIATLLVYFWTVPYVLICAGSIVLLQREGKLNTVTIIAAVLGGGLMAWILINAIIAPPAAPADAMIIVFAVLTIGLSLYFAATGKKSIARGITPYAGEETV